jgi:predicted TIM-barrel fold metal-dependent hydrolase
VLPSHYFHRNYFASFQEDAIGLRLRDVIGTHALMWGSDYPHTESTLPRSPQILATILDGIPEDEARRIVAGNAVDLYGFNLPAVSTAGDAQ